MGKKWGEGGAASREAAAGGRFGGWSVPAWSSWRLLAGRPNARRLADMCTRASETRLRCCSGPRASPRGS